ncbi:MAG: hypothetical protein RSF87_10735 [Cellulosilyticaceae bacterium]
MKKKSLFITISIVVIISIIAITYILNWNSTVNVNTRYLEDKLTHNQGEGQVKDLIGFNYDKVYIFEPYQPKESMESLIGFECSILKETVSEGMMNILFLESNVPVAYLYGYASNNGYYIELPVGTYTKSELNNMGYIATKHAVGNSAGTPQTYMHYLFTK